MMLQPLTPLAQSRLSSSMCMGLVVASLLIGGCASRPSVQPTARLVAIPEFYTVQRGDTLGGIAARFGLDYREVGRLNQVDNNYTIYTEQRLRLRGQGNDSQRVRVLTPQGAVPAAALSTRVLPAVPRRTVPAAAPNTTVPKAVTPAASNTSVNTVPVQPANTNTPTATTQQAWFWPVDQPVAESYDLARKIKGLRFLGQIGDSVRASADGQVVYADDGLQEYGKLVLIKHLNGYISAYAHNSRLLVRENDRVKAGQTIAEMGNSGTDRVMLEFQVRLNGKPIDPREVLSPNR